MRRPISDDHDKTVFYQPPLTRADGVFLVNHAFGETGNYIGIVTAAHPDMNKTYTAVFPFRVGFGGWGYAPWFIGLAVFLQLNYWLMAGGYTRWKDKRAAASSVIRT